MMNICHAGRTKSPCRFCEDRDSDCHANCEKYIEFSKIHEKERTKIHKEKHKESLGYGAPYRTERKLKNDIRNARNGKKGY